MLAKSVNELQVCQLAVQLQRKVFEISKTFPKEERYSLTDQIRRSSRSVGANICEAWTKRRYPAHFESKLSDSDGESEETIHWLITAYDCRYISNEVRESLANDYKHVSGILNKMMDNAKSWCKHYIAEQ